MTLKPVPQSKLEGLLPFFEPICAELNATERITVKEWMEIIGRGYEGRYLDVYVDDFEDPKHCLVLCRMPGGVDRGVVTVVRLIYSKPDHRNDEDAVKTMMTTIDNYHKIHGTTAILASSWKFRGSRPIDSLWLDNGFEVQETTYVKL